MISSHAPMFTHAAPCQTPTCDGTDNLTSKMQTVRTDTETDRLIGALSKRIAQQTRRDVVRVVVDMLRAADLAGLDGEARLELFRERLAAKQRYCKAEGLDLATYVDAQYESEVNAAVARIRRAMLEG